jgi:membrane protease YdiL (CAAX protease family)
MAELPVAILPSDSATTTQQQSFSWPTLLLLYLGPGLALTAFYSVAAPLFLTNGLPAIWGLLIGALVVIVPIELSILLLYSRHITGQARLQPSIAYRARLSVREYLWLIPTVVLATFLLPGLVVILEPWIRSTFFAWLPTWFSAGLTSLASYSPAIQRITIILWLGAAVIIGPIVEEFYFRGFLLPRTAHRQWFAPLVNALLFAIYHFWQPYAVLTITLFAIPLAYFVWWKKNIMISIFAHCIVNMIAFFSLFTGIVQR